MSARACNGFRRDTPTTMQGAGVVSSGGVLRGTGPFKCIVFTCEEFGWPHGEAPHFVCDRHIDMLHEMFSAKLRELRDEGALD